MGVARISDDPNLSWNKSFLEMWQLFLQILEKVARTHQQGLIHGDLKGDNIMTHNDEIRLLDLGFSMVVGSQTVTQSSCDTFQVTEEITTQEEEDDETADSDDDSGEEKPKRSHHSSRYAQNHSPEEYSSRTRKSDVYGLGYMLGTFLHTMQAREECWEHKPDSAVLNFRTDTNICDQEVVFNASIVAALVSKSHQKTVDARPGLDEIIDYTKAVIESLERGSPSFETVQSFHALVDSEISAVDLTVPTTQNMHDFTE